MSGAGSAIALYARATPGFEERLAATIALLRQAAGEFPGAIVLATSGGAEDQVLTDLVARHGLGIDIATLETGRLHPETLELLARTERHYGVSIARVAPPPQAVLQFVAAHGEDAMYRSVALRKACCALRKLEPLQRLLAGRAAWVTGLRREQSEARTDVAPRALDEAGRVKFAPLAAWSQQDVWHHIATRGVPYHALHDRFFPSIGCAPCTRAITVGEDIRAGRWWWEHEAAKECGLHVDASAAAPGSVSAFDPAPPAAVSALPGAPSTPATGAPA